MIKYVTNIFFILGLASCSKLSTSVTTAKQSRMPASNLRKVEGGHCFQCETGQQKNPLEAVSLAITSLSSDKSPDIKNLINRAKKLKQSIATFGKIGIYGNANAQKRLEKESYQNEIKKICEKFETYLGKNRRKISTIKAMNILDILAWKECDNCDAYKECKLPKGYNWEADGPGAFRLFISRGMNVP